MKRCTSSPRLNGRSSEGGKTVARSTPRRGAALPSVAARPSAGCPPLARLPDLDGICGLLAQHLGIQTVVVRAVEEEALARGAGHAASEAAVEKATPLAHRVGHAVADGEPPFRGGTPVVGQALG